MASSRVIAGILASTLLLGTLIQGCTELDDYHDWCSIWTYNDCWCHMDDHVDDLDDSIVPTYTQEELEPLCDAYGQVQHCITQFVHDCHVSLQNRFDSVDSSWSYICDETKDVFLTQHRTCLDNEELHDEGDIVCYDPFMDQLDRIRESEEHTLEEKYERQCHQVNNYLDCVENLILSFNCSQATALWQRELDRRWIEPLLRGTNCEIHNSTGKIIYQYKSTSGSDGQQGDDNDTDSSDKKSGVPAAVVGVVGAILGLIIILLILVVIYKVVSNKKKEQARQAREAQAQQARPPNAYSQPYGYGGGAVAFGVFNEPLPGKDGEKGDSENPPAYGDHGYEEMGSAPPSQPPPYTGFPQGVGNPLYTNSGDVVSPEVMTGVETATSD